MHNVDPIPYIRTLVPPVPLPPTTECPTLPHHVSRTAPITTAFSPCPFLRPCPHPLHSTATMFGGGHSASSSPAASKAGGARGPADYAALFDQFYGPDSIMDRMVAAQQQGGGGGGGRGGNKGSSRTQGRGSSGRSAVGGKIR